LSRAVWQQLRIVAFKEGKTCKTYSSDARRIICERTSMAAVSDETKHS